MPVGPLVAAVGAVLLVVSLFLDWYERITGFTAFEFLDLLLVMCALLTIASLAGGLGLVKPAPRPLVSLAVAVFTVLVVASQVVNHPPIAAGEGGPGKDVGIWLALAGAASDGGRRACSATRASRSRSRRAAAKGPDAT